MDLGNLIQVSMDGPNTNKKFLRLLIEAREKNNDLPLVDIGTCTVHSVSGAFKTADEKTLNVGKFLLNSYYVFKDSPARLLEANELQSSKFPKKFCPTRWVENGPVARHILGLLESISKFIDNIKGTAAEPKTQSYSAVKSSLNDPLLPAKIAFFAEIAGKLEPFLEKYQTDNPLVPFMADDLQDVFIALGGMILKDAYLQKVHRTELTDDKLLHPDDLKLVLGVRHALRKIRSNDKMQIARLKGQCFLFVKTLLSKLQASCPLKSRFLRSARALNPTLWMKRDGGSELAIAESSLEALLDETVKLFWFEGHEADMMKGRMSAKLKEDAFQEKARSWDGSSQPLDDFWQGVFEPGTAEDKLVKRVLTLSHGQAAVERGFNVNKEATVENQLEESLVAQRFVYDGVREKGLAEMDIPKGMIRMARNANRRYKEWKEAKKKQEENRSQKENERKRQAVVLLAKEEERKRLRRELEALDADINQLKQ